MVYGTDAEVLMTTRLYVDQHGENRKCPTTSGGSLGSRISTIFAKQFMGYIEKSIMTLSKPHFYTDKYS
jgi:hypothetical protein